MNNWGVVFELQDNTYKPFPSGIVIHPTIDACIQLREKHQMTADQIVGIELQSRPWSKTFVTKKS